MKAICGKCKARVKIKDDSDENKMFFNCPICKTKNKLILPKNQKMTEEKTLVQSSLGDVKGWLVVHDESTSQQTFTLKSGKNVVGRKSESKPCEVMVDTEDSYMSRNHFAIEISLGNKGLEYLVFDVTSTNGTFINANKNNKLSQTDQVYLQDGDTIQAGRTKMVLRTKKMAGTAKNATSTVINTKPLQTVIVT
jgi:pSer/pThr/pTyr-binding forkhead associated (FHA) protein